MQQLVTPETFQFFAQYFLAGFVLLSARSWFVLGERPRPNETLIEGVILSLINQFVFIYSFGWLSPNWINANANIYLLIEVLIQPLVIGGLAGWAIGANWFPAGLRRIFMPTTRPVRKTFGQAFDQLVEPVYVIVAFKDGKEVYGYFGEDSVASTDPEEGGIFFERLYDISEQGDWIEVSPNRSAWLTLDNVHSIEFLKNEENENAQNAL